MNQTEIKPELETPIETPIEWTDLQNFIRHEISTKNVYQIDIYKNYYMYTNDRTYELSQDDELWRENLKSPLTNMFTTKVSNMVKWIDKRFVATDKFSDTREEELKALPEEMLDTMDYLWKRSWTREAFEDWIDDAILIGRWVFAINYKFLKKTKKIKNKDGTNDDIEEVIYDYPYLSYVSPLNFFIDPQAKNIDSARFIAERKILFDDEIKENFSMFSITYVKKEMDDKSDRVSDLDYETVKRNMPYYNSSIPRNVVEDKTYNIKKEAREVIQISTKNSITIYINGEKFWPYPTIWPLDTYKYNVIQFKKNPWTIFALGIGFLLRPIQRAYDIIWNTRLDNVKLTANKVFKYVDGFNAFGNTKRMKLKPWMMFKVNNMADIQEMAMSEIKESSYRETGEMFSLLQATTGVSSGSLGLQDKVERTASGANNISEAKEDQLKPLMDSIISNMADVMREMLVLCKYYWDNEKRDAVLGNWNQMKNVSIDVLINEYEYDFYMESQNHKRSAVERQQLMNFLQVAMSAVDAAGRPISDVREIVEKLWESFEMNGKAILDEEDYNKMITDAENFKVVLQNQLMQQQVKAQKKVQPQAPQWWEAEMRNLQQLGGANIPPEMTTNNQWQS